MLTSTQARVLLDRVAKENPERWPAAVQTLIVGTLESLEQMARVVSALVQSAAPAESVAGDAPAAAPAEAAAPASPADAEEAERRANMTPEQLELEAQMDAAIAASGEPAPPPSPPKKGKKAEKPGA